MLSNTMMTQRATSNANEFDIKFTLGNGKCSELVDTEITCNPPLPYDMRIGVVLRVYTENGYKDSNDIVFLDFELLNESIFFTPNIAVIIVLSGIIILSIIICVCCCSARQKEIVKDESQVEADENLLSFTSYCVIDKNPAKHSNV